jgi:hypothetical protein
MSLIQDGNHISFGYVLDRNQVYLKRPLLSGSGSHTSSLIQISELHIP